MRAGRCDPPPTLQSNREQRFISVTLRSCESFHVLRPHPEEPERSEGVSKDGRESESVAMVRDGALRAPPHHEAERKPETRRIAAKLTQAAPAMATLLTMRPANQQRLAR